MNKVTFSVVFLIFLGFSVQVKPSDKGTVSSGSSFTDGLVACAAVATFADLLTGQKGSITRAFVSTAGLALTMTTDNKFSPESAYVSAAIIGNHVDNWRKNKYTLWSSQSKE